MSAASVTVPLGQLCGDVEEGYGGVADAFRAISLSAAR